MGTKPRSLEKVKGSINELVQKALDALENAEDGTLIDFNINVNSNIHRDYGDNGLVLQYSVPSTTYSITFTLKES